MTDNGSSGTGTTVWIIDTAKNAVVGSMTGFSVPNTLAVTPESAHLYVGNTGWHTVSVVSTHTNTIKGTITVESGPRAMK